MKGKSLLIYQSATQTVNGYTEGIQIFLGSLYIALLSQVEIPLNPIPVTLQTFAVFSLALFQGSRKSCFSLLLYLMAATIGLPVFPSVSSDPFWILHPAAGYCLSFPLAAYVVGRFSEMRKDPSMGWILFGLCCAQVIMTVMGVTWLRLYVDGQQALAVGLYPFILFDLIKLLAAFSIKMVTISKE